MKLLLVDDEPLARPRRAGLLRDKVGVEVVGVGGHAFGGRAGMKLKRWIVAGCLASAVALASLALLLADDLAALLFPWIMLPVLLAELSLSLWMIIKGVNMQQWQQSCEN